MRRVWKKAGRGYAQWWTVSCDNDLDALSIKNHLTCSALRMTQGALQIDFDFQTERVWIPICIWSSHIFLSCYFSQRQTVLAGFRCERN